MFVLEYRFGKGAPKEKPEQPRPRELLFDSPLKHQWIGEWTPIDSYEIDFFRPFAGVFANGADYFVSDDGRVFRSPATTAGPNRRANELTLRDGELVQALIYDHDRGNAAFAFTSKYWFEVQEPIEYREFELGVLKADDPLPTLVRAAREVRKFYPAIPQVEPRKPDPPQADPVNTDAPPAGPSNGAPAPQ